MTYECLESTIIFVNFLIAAKISQLGFRPLFHLLFFRDYTSSCSILTIIFTTHLNMISYSMSSFVVTAKENIPYFKKQFYILILSFAICILKCITICVVNKMRYRDYLLTEQRDRTSCIFGVTVCLWIFLNSRLF